MDEAGRQIQAQLTLKHGAFLLYPVYSTTRLEQIGKRPPLLIS